jgi:hypothetical protein
MWQIFPVAIHKFDPVIANEIFGFSFGPSRKARDEWQVGAERPRASAWG